jgi:hypothetical protein
MSPAPGEPAVLAAAAADWERLSVRLPAGILALLAGHLGDARAATPGSTARAEAITAASDLVRPWLAQGDTRLTGTLPVPPPGFTAADLGVLVLDGHRLAGPVLGPVRDRLLAAPALYDSTVERYGGDPSDPRLIRLRGTGGRIRLPKFQFEPEPSQTAGCVPRPLVLEVNAVLAADRDPWGAADWWLSPNAWLGGESPAALLGTGHRARVLDAARFLAEGE